MSVVTLLIYCNDDGETVVATINPNNLTDELENHGLRGRTAFPGAVGLPRNTDFWAGNYLIVRGTVMVARAVEVVTRYELEPGGP